MAVAVEALERVETVRARLTAISPQLADDAEAALREALRGTRRVRAQRQCAKCKCSHIEYVEVQDTPRVLEAVKLVMEQTEGRPGVADQEQAEALAVQRTVYTAVDAAHALALLDAGDLEQLRRELTSSL